MRGFRRGFVAIVSACALVMVVLPATRSSAAQSSGGEFAAHGRKKYLTRAAANSRRAQQAAEAAAAEPQLTYGGGVHGIGVTTGAPRVYLVFWGSQWGTASPAGSTNLSGDAAWHRACRRCSPVSVRTTSSGPVWRRSTARE
jgi:hypothetical protein